MLVDEGGDYMNEYGVAVATVGTAEKGYLDARVEVTAPGGHSSVPPAHTVSLTMYVIYTFRGLKLCLLCIDDRYSIRPARAPGSDAY